jgi:hypothetical protein
MSDFVQYEQACNGGRIVGELDALEDAPALAQALLEAPKALAEGERQLLLHADLSSLAGRAEHAAKLRALAEGRLGRYVFRLDTRVGPRIVKVTEIHSLGNALLGLAASSTARREHHNQSRATSLGLATTASAGFLEWRRGALLRRACQIQTLVPSGLRTVDETLPSELARFGEAALEPLARALAATHKLGFFHADLKGFHAHVRPSAGDPMEPASYDLTWIDLARVGFKLSRRQRIINLYQVLRFILPAHPLAHARFIEHYTRAAGWHADAPEEVLVLVRDFLAHKYLTHPIA